MNQLLECIVRWETMQSSTVTYAENASLDLIEAETCCEEHLGVLDAALLREAPRVRVLVRLSCGCPVPPPASRAS